MTEEATTPDLVGLARQGYEAAGRGDLDGVMSVFADDAVYDMSAAGLETFEGREAIRDFVETWHRSWEDYRYEEEELLDLGHGVVLSVLREGGRLVGGDGRVEQRVAHLTTWANDKIEWFKHYPDPDQARAAAERLAAERGQAVSGKSTTPDLVGLVREQAEAANRRDLNAVMNAFAEDAIMTGGARGFPPSEGRAAIGRFIEDWFDAYEELHFEFEEVSDLGNGVVFGVLIQEGRPVGTAAHVGQREGWVYIWARGLIARLETTYFDIAEGCAAAERLAAERG
jgi:ketosteroid isomerase-like protein